MERKKAAVVGCGHLGREAAAAISAAPDLRLAGIYSRRGKDACPAGEDTALFHPLDSLCEGCADILLLCGSSARDLPDWTPRYAARFSVVDAFDIHADAPAHFARADAAARAGMHTAVVCAGWDPGIFSLVRLWGACFFGDPSPETVWGPGVSEGHSAFLRTIPGVKDAICRTIPQGNGYCRKCQILPENNANKEEIMSEIRKNRSYFGDCRVETEFLSPARFDALSDRTAHGGRVTLRAHDGAAAMFDLRLPSNPRFTAAVLTAAARAALRLRADGKYGAFTFADIPPLLFSPAANRFAGL